MLSKYQITRLFLFCGLSLLLALTSNAQVNVGIVADRLSGENSVEALALIQSELKQIFGKDQAIEIKADHIYSTENNSQIAIQQFQKLNDSQEIDLVLLLGANCNEDIVQSRLDFKKPTVGLGVFNTVAQNIPITSIGSSGIKNYSYVLFPMELNGLIRSFHADIFPYKKLGIVIPSSNAQIFQSLPLDGLNSDLSAIHEFVLDDSSKESLMRKIDQGGYDALVMAFFYQRSPNDLKSVVDSLNKKGIPTVALSSDFVDAGMLATQTEDRLLSKAIRKMAVMSEWAVDGQELSEMPVKLEVNTNYWYINLGTVTELDMSLPFRLLFEAKFPSYDEINNFTRQISFYEIVAMALENNLSLLIEDQDVEFAHWNVKEAVTSFLPGADASTTYTTIDRTSAENSFGSQAQHTVSGNITGQQLLFSHQAIANLKIQKQLKLAAQLGYESLALDVVNQATSLYFQLLQLKANVKIQKNNLDLSRQNLDLARQRFEIGQASESEVFRWEAQQAQGLQSLVEAHTNEYIAQKNLAFIVNLPIEEDFTVEDASEEDETFAFYDRKIMDAYLSDFKRIEKFTNFLIADAMLEHPLLNQVELNNRALEIQSRMNTLNYALPSIAFQTQQNYVFKRSGAGTDGSTSIPGIDLGSPSKYSWNAALNLSYPIFEGHKRRIDLQKTNINIHQLGLQREQLQQSIKVNVATAVSNLIAAHTNLDFTEQSSNSAKKSLDLVQASYRSGFVSVAELVDAQNSAIQTQAAYNSAYYSYLSSIYNLQYAVGHYLFLDNEQDIIEFTERLNQYMLSQTE